MSESNGFEMPRPGEPHARLAKLAGRWDATETMFPSPWDPAGGARRARTVNRLTIDGFFLLNEYEQEHEGAVVFRGLGIYGWDAQRERYSMYWVDSMGAPPSSAVWGSWEADTLTFAHETPRGHTRYVYVFEADDRYVFRLESSPDGETWAPMMIGTYTRVGDA
ncbi:MAG: DUF1579 family protein [Sandaracinaceae bacterium]|nr:DUF1579 family protein [Sandaracinaceae bacterium]